MSKKVVKAATERAVQRTTSRAMPAVTPFGVLLGELGFTVALEAVVPDTVTAVALATPAVTLTTLGVAALVRHQGRDRSPVGRLFGAGTVALTGTHQVWTLVAGSPFAGSLLWTWAWVGGSAALLWSARRWISGAPRPEGEQRGGNWWAEAAEKTGGAFTGSWFRAKEVTEDQMKGRLQLEPGQVVDDAQAARKSLASQLGLPPGGVRITPDPDNASRGEMTLTRKDLLRHPRSYEGPSAVGDTVVTPYLVGYYESGAPAMLPTHIAGGGERHLLIQGMNGAGKTQGAYLIFAEEFTRRENYTIYIDTVKGAQSLGPIARGLRWVIQTESEAHALMRKLIKNVIPARAHYLGRKGLKNWQPGCGIPRLAIHVEEGSGLFLGNKDFTRALERIRSVGIELRLSGQRFSYTSVDVSARAQFASVWCFGVAELDDARFVMPEEAIDAGADPAQWKNKRPGCSYLIAPGIEDELHVTPMRTLWIEDEQLELLAEYAHRNGEELDDLDAQAFGDLYASRIPVEQLLAEGPPPVVDEDDEDDWPDDDEDDEEKEDEVPEEDQPQPFRPPVPDPDDPDADVLPDLDDELPEVEDFPLGTPPAKKSPEEAREMFETRLVSLQAEGVGTVTAKHLAPVAAEAGMSPAWVYRQLALRVDSGHLERTDNGWRFVRALTPA